MNDDVNQELSSDALALFLGPLLFRAADKFFKFVSWALVIGVISYIDTVSGARSVRYLYHLATGIFSLALMAQVFYLVTRHPSTLGVSKPFYGLSRFCQFVAGGILLAVLTSPYLILDDLLLQLGKAHLR